jgi:hypothetical protein
LSSAKAAGFSLGADYRLQQSRVGEPRKGIASAVDLEIGWAQCDDPVEHGAADIDDDVLTNPGDEVEGSKPLPPPPNLRLYAQKPDQAARRPRDPGTSVETDFARQVYAWRGNPWQPER